LSFVARHLTGFLYYWN